LVKVRLPRRILYSSAEVRSAIVNLFHDGGARRIAISAFVGDGADAYLPNPKGLRLICSPTPGATNPNALRHLLKQGTKVEFVDSLHMKIYWAEGRGAVITSANLSTNAMGIGGLKEAGVLLSASEVDIDRIVTQLKPRPAEPELRRLDLKHREYFKRVGWTGVPRNVVSFPEWYESPVRERWKFCVCSTFSTDLSDTAIQSVRKEFNKKPHDWIFTERRQYRPDDRILAVNVKGKRVTQIHWFFADRVFAVPRSDRNFDRYLPFETVQIHGPKQYTPPPFSSDRRFRAALASLNSSGRLPDSDANCVLGDSTLRVLYHSLS
jgi:hypothetical protein